MVEFSNYVKNIFKSYFWKPLLTPKGGWMGDHALYALIENLFNMCMNRVVGMSYILDPHYIFNWYHNWYFHVCILICVFYICMLQTSNSINFDWYLIFHTYIQNLIVLTISLHLKVQIMFILSLTNFFNINWYLYKLMHYFQLVFQLISKYTSYFTF